MPIGHGIWFKPANIRSQEQIRNNIRSLVILVHKGQLRKLKSGKGKKMKKDAVDYYQKPRNSPGEYLTNQFASEAFICDFVFC